MVFCLGLWSLVFGFWSFREVTRDCEREAEARDYKVRKEVKIVKLLSHLGHF